MLWQYKQVLFSSCLNALESLAEKCTYLYVNVTNQQSVFGFLGISWDDDRQNSYINQLLLFFYCLVFYSF